MVSIVIEVFNIDAALTLLLKLCDGTSLRTAIAMSTHAFVRFDGIASDGTITTGEILVDGDQVSGETIASGGTLVVDALRVLTDAKLPSGGTVVIDALGVSTSATIASGGLLKLYPQSSATGTTIEPGGAIDLTYLPYVAGGLATVNAAGLLTVALGAHTYTQQLVGTYFDEFFSLSDDGLGAPSSA